MSVRLTVFVGAALVVAAMTIAVAGQARQASTARDADAALRAQVRLLLDKQEIHDTMMRYARGVDRGDAELISSVFWPDAIDDHGGGTYRRGSDTGKAFAEGRKPTAMRRQMGQHFIGNDLIEVEGDVAYAEFYFLSDIPGERNGEEYTRHRAGRYLDRWERRNGQWKVAYRAVVDDWDRMDKVVEGIPESAGWRRGGLREADPIASMRSGAMRDAEAAIRAKLDRAPQ